MTCHDCQPQWLCEPCLTAAPMEAKNEGHGAGQLWAEKWWRNSDRTLTVEQFLVPADACARNWLRRRFKGDDRVLGMGGVNAFCDGARQWFEGRPERYR